jgi:ABC-type glycerol-3-phosphate transport system substrate-binding protein
MRGGQTRGGGLTRRAALRGAAWAVVAGAAAGWPTDAWARPTRASGVVTVTWAPWHGGFAFGKNLVDLFEVAIQPFLATHRGIRVKFSPNCCDGTALVTAVLAGTAPDLSSQYNWGVIHAAKAALDLSPYIKQYNLDLRVFSQGRIAHWSTPQGVFGLPSYTNVYGMIVNTTALTELNVPIPPKDWTYEQAAATFRAATRKTSRGVVSGGAVACHHSGVLMPASFYLAGFGASYVDPRDPARCVADTPEAIAAAEWVFSQLIDQVATNISSCWPKHMAAGQTVIDGFGLCAMAQIASQLRGFAWDFWPMPSFPKGRFTSAGPDSYVIAATSKHPDAAWELLYWFVTDPTWQRWQMRALLGAPAVESLWPEYYEVLATAAPHLRDKDLSVLGQLGHIHIRSDFAFADPQAVAIMKKWGQAIVAQQVSIAQGMVEMTEEINALEASQAKAPTASA